MSNILYIFAEISGGGRGSMRPAEAHCWLEGAATPAAAAEARWHPPRAAPKKTFFHCHFIHYK